MFNLKSATMQTSKIIRVADLVNENPNAAVIFKKYNIDFCCKGKTPLHEACEKAGISEATVYSEIQNLTRQPGGNLRIHSWSNAMICDYIVNNHHNYVRETLPQILALSQKVANRHGENRPELVKVYHKFQQLSHELMQHLEKEEQLMFPAVKQDALTPQLIAEIEGEHDQAGELMAEINQLTSSYHPPADACTSYRLLFQLLEEFEDDLHQHVHVENNILIPKATLS
jgi:regulator of cell morphogenesis and NO signaling